MRKRVTRSSQRLDRLDSAVQGALLSHRRPESQALHTFIDAGDTQFAVYHHLDSLVI